MHRVWLTIHPNFAVTGTLSGPTITTLTGNSLPIPNISVPGSVSVTGTVTRSNITMMNTKITTLETKTTGLSNSSGTTVFDSVPKIGKRVSHRLLLSHRFYLHNLGEHIQPEYSVGRYMGEDRGKGLIRVQ